MTKKFIGTVLAASIALTSFGALPAAAKPNDGVRILQGLAALYIISRVVKDNKRRKHVAAKPSVPNRCIRNYSTPNGWQRSYSAYCIKRQAPNLRLPQQCKRRIWTEQGRRNVYGINCLSQFGYAVPIQ